MSTPTGVGWPGLPALLTGRDPRADCSRSVVTSVDRDGRLADRSIMRLLGWQPGFRIAMSVERGPIVVVRPGDSERINARGYVRLPLRIRRRCAVNAGSRVLVAALEPHEEALVLPMWVLDTILRAVRASRSPDRATP